MKSMTLLCVCVCSLTGCAPSMPVQVTLKAPPQTFTGQNHCRVRVEPLVFDPALRLGELSEAQFIAQLKPEQQQSYLTDKTASSAMFAEQLQRSHGDYVGSRGNVVAAGQGDEPYLLRSRVTSFDPKVGIMLAVHELVQTADNRKIGEFTANVRSAGFGSGERMRGAAVGQAWSVLKYFGDRFACNSPARVVD